jgi:hypothetical protein
MNYLEKKALLNNVKSQSTKHAVDAIMSLVQIKINRITKEPLAHPHHWIFKVRAKGYFTFAKHTAKDRHGSKFYGSSNWMDCCSGANYLDVCDSINGRRVTVTSGYYKGAVLVFYTKKVVVYDLADRPHKKVTVLYKVE